MKKILEKLSEIFRIPTNEERMITFLSQARDQVHLEQLQRDWDRMQFENVWNKRHYL